MSHRSQLIKDLEIFLRACAAEQFSRLKMASFPDSGSTCLVLFGEKRPVSRKCGGWPLKKVNNGIAS